MLDAGMNYMADPWGLIKLDYGDDIPDEEKVTDILAYWQIAHADMMPKQKGKGKSGKPKEMTDKELKWIISPPTSFRDLSLAELWKNGQFDPKSPANTQISGKTDLTSRLLQKQLAIEGSDPAAIQAFARLGNRNE